MKSKFSRCSKWWTSLTRWHSWPTAVVSQCSTNFSNKPKDNKIREISRLTNATTINKTVTTEEVTIITGITTTTTTEVTTMVTIIEEVDSITMDIETTTTIIGTNRCKRCKVIRTTKIKITKKKRSRMMWRWKITIISRIFNRWAIRFMHKYHRFNQFRLFLNQIFLLLHLKSHLFHLKRQLFKTLHCLTIANSMLWSQISSEWILIMQERLLLQNLNQMEIHKMPQMESLKSKEGAHHSRILQIRLLVNSRNRLQTKF